MSYPPRLSEVSRNLQKMSKETEDLVKSIIAERFDISIDEIKLESSFVDDLGADSLDTVELLMQFEEVFKCEISDDDAEKIATVQQAVDYINAHKKK